MSNISEDRNMGRIGIVLKEEYDPEKTYTKLNQVTYSGSSYTLKVAEATGILPTNTDYWICSAKKGDQGEKGDKGDVGPIGPKPVNGTDYNTNAEREEFKNAVVADSKADLEKYITEKETQLDNYTKDKETKLDDYVTDTVKPTIDTYVTDTTKKGIDAYEKEKEKVLDTYTDTKKTEIDNYVTNTSKPALDQYEKDKEAELETAKNTAISEYDAHAESVLTETGDLFNALDTEKASGTELYIDDAKACRVISSDIDGMYKQETTLGINIDNTKLLTTVTKHGITRTIMNDGGIKLEGTATAQWNIPIFPTELAHLEEGAYTFVCYGLPTDLSINIYYVGNVSGETVKKFTANGTRDYYMNLIVTEGTTVNCTLYPFLIKGSYTADNIPKYEPFTDNTPSPNPDYPQAIEQVDSVKLNINNKNLLNPIFTVGSNCTIENQTITSTVLPAQTVQFIRFSFPKIKLKKGIKYYISFSAKKINTNYAGGFNQVQLFTADNKKFINFSAIANPNLNENYQRYNFVSANITEEQALLDYVKILIQRKDIAEDLVFAITDVMVTKENTEYMPYQNQAINIDLKGNKLCAISDTIKDKLLIDRDGNVALQKNVGKNIFDGTKKWKKSSFIKNTIFYLTNTQKAKSSDVGICNYFPVKKVWDTDILGLELYDLNNIRVGLTRNSEIQTEDAFNEWLTTHNLEVYYVLATPELIDLGQLPELPKTFNGINNVWAETNLGNTEIEIEYVQDVKKLLEQQNARLDSIEALLSTTQTSAMLLDNMQSDLEKEVE